jgi:hypothetical protein
MKIAAVFVAAAAVALGVLFARFEPAAAVDCEGTTETCGWYFEPPIQALSSGLFAADLTWDWYIAGDDEDVGVVFAEWDFTDPDDDNVQDVEFSPDFWHWDNTNCNGPEVTTLSGDLISTAANGVVAIRGVVAHHSVEVCEQDKNITVLMP